MFHLVLNGHAASVRPLPPLQVERLNKLVFAALVRNPFTGESQDPRATFAQLDEDGSGTVDRDEFREGLRTCGLELSEEETDLVWGALDVDGDGDLSADEICAVRTPARPRKGGGWRARRAARITRYGRCVGAGRGVQEDPGEGEGDPQRPPRAPPRRHVPRVRIPRICQFAAHNLRVVQVMPRLLHHALAPLVGGGCARVRVDLQKDFMDTPAAQEKRWLKRFADDLVKDLQGILPVKCPPTPHTPFLSATVCSLPRLWTPKRRPRRRRRCRRGVARARALSSGAKVLDLAACAAAEEGERLTSAGDARTRLCYHPDVAEGACHASHLAFKTEEVRPRPQAGHGAFVHCRRDVSN